VIGEPLSTPAWPNDRVLLSVDDGLSHSRPYGEQWWHIFHSTYSELKARAGSRAVGPERDLQLQPRPYRSLQLGLSGEASRRYADKWTIAIRDVTPLAHEMHAMVRVGELEAATRLLPEERPYPVEDELLAPLRE
jgi:hypothetical protein